MGKLEGYFSARWIFLKEGGAYMRSYCDCSIDILRLGECHGTDEGQV